MIPCFVMSAVSVFRSYGEEGNRSVGGNRFTDICQAGCVCVCVCVCVCSGSREVAPLEVSVSPMKL